MLNKSVVTCLQVCAFSHHKRCALICYFKKVVSASAIRPAHVPLTIVCWLECQWAPPQRALSQVSDCNVYKNRLRDCESRRWNLRTDSCTHHWSQQELSLHSPCRFCKWCSKWSLIMHSFCILYSCSCPRLQYFLYSKEKREKKIHNVFHNWRFGNQ